MDINVLKDLIPSYIDGIASPATNRLLEDALKNNLELRQYYEEMKRGMALDPKKELKAIDPLKKVKRKNRKKIIFSVLASAVVVLAAVTGYLWYYNQTWLAKSSEVEQTVSKVGEIVELMYADKDGQHQTIALQTTDNKARDGYQPVVEVKQKRISPIDPPLQKNGYAGFTFKDKNTIYLDNGIEHQLGDRDVLTVKYQDKTVKVKIRDLYDGKVK